MAFWIIIIKKLIKYSLSIVYYEIDAGKPSKRRKLVYDYYIGFHKVRES